MDGGRDRDRTCDPYHVKVVSRACACLLGAAQLPNYLIFSLFYTGYRMRLLVPTCVKLLAIC
jgi:hypothetical protein